MSESEICRYLRTAVAAVEDQWEGAKAIDHPQIVAALIQAAALRDLKEIVHDEIAPGLQDIARSLDNVAATLGSLGDK
jgi:uncharacterized protein YfiM (DUF2279 family)